MFRSKNDIYRRRCILVLVIEGPTQFGPLGSEIEPDPVHGPGQGQPSHQQGYQHCTHKQTTTLS